MLNVVLIFGVACLPFAGIWLESALKAKHPGASKAIGRILTATAVVLLVVSMCVKCSGPIDAGHRGLDY